MLGWSTKRVARLVEEALRHAPAGPVAVVGEPPLAKALAAGGREVAASAAVDGADGDAALAAVIAVGEGSPDDWTRAVKDGGVLVLVDKAAPPVGTRRALCAALHDLEQRVAGKVVVTSGRVRRFS
jgi:hypothetical protein